MGGLVLVKAGEFIQPRRELLLVSLRGERKTVRVEERPIKIPKIDLLLSDFYTLGDIAPCGTQMLALLPYISEGKRRHLCGTVGFLGGKALVAVPIGFFDGGLN
jgi:hypothetical protein